MKSEYYKNYINWDTKGRSDITPILENPEVFRNLINDLVKGFGKISFDKIVGIDALGFIFASAVALKTKKPLVLIRKEGKLPHADKDLLRTKFTDYTRNKKILEIKKTSISKGDKIIIIDEWTETGAQIKAAIILIEELGGEVVKISSINIDRNENTKPLFDKYNLKSIIGN